ncbi:hypothetical protein HAZT_HAZT003375 [Hyalella azteca]|uniref:Uncharacterized protein n=1 Tax=Hyalella azteca TaxID=294128 RepID=A0A6A0GZT8_HYAAZ|nr:hypothetical protein HAZT_HAZT003375 [Hyalella azteca]
MPLFHLCLSYR